MSRRPAVESWTDGAIIRSRVYSETGYTVDLCEDHANADGCRRAWEAVYGRRPGGAPMCLSFVLGRNASRACQVPECGAS